jgi:hypothetical protein
VTCTVHEPAVEPPAEAASWPDCRGCRPGGMVLTFRRADRSFAEILQEVRVAQTGVQLLVAFLLTAPFAPDFVLRSAAERALYVTSLVAGTFSSALLIAPVAFHRLVYGRRMKRELVRAANRFTQGATALMLVAVVSVLTLILTAVTDDRTAMVITLGVVAWFVGWWYVIPCLNVRRWRG